MTAAPDMAERAGRAAYHAGEGFRPIAWGENFDDWKRERVAAMGRAAIAAMPTPADLNTRLWSADQEGDDAPYTGRD